MLLEIGKKLLGNATLPPPLATLATVAQLAVVVCTVAEALSNDEEGKP